MCDSVIVPKKQEDEINNFPVIVPDDPIIIFKTGKKYYTVINQYDDKGRRIRKYETNYDGYWIKKETNYFGDSTVTINYASKIDKEEYYNNPEISPLAYQYYTTGDIEIIWNKNRKKLTIDSGYKRKTLYYYKDNGDTVVTEHDMNNNTIVSNTLWGYNQKLRKKYKQNWRGSDSSTKYEENFYYDSLARLLIYEKIDKGVLKEKNQYKYDETGDYCFKNEYYTLSDDISRREIL